MGRLTNKFGVPLFLTIIGVVIISVGEYKSPLYQEMERIADLNGPVPELRGNGIPDPKEWEEVYAEFGLEYNPSFSIPVQDLTPKQMREYIINHQ